MRVMAMKMAMAMAMAMAMDEDGDGDEGDKAPKKEEEEEKVDLAANRRNTIIRNAFEFGEEECQRRYRGAFGPSSNSIIFAVPADMDQNVESLANNVQVMLSDPGMVSEGEIAATLGVQCQAYTGSGVYVRAVEPLGAATHASICPGDVIVTVDAFPVDTPSDFTTIEKNLELGKVIDVEVVRGFDGRAEILKVEVFSTDREEYGPEHVRTTRMSMGLANSSQQIFTQTTALKRLESMVAHLGLTHGSADGSVKDIHKGGPAERAGIVDSDLIKSVNGVVLDESNSLVEALQKYRAGDWVTVGFASDGADKSVEVELAAAGETVEGVRAARLMAGVVTVQLDSAKGLNDAMLVESSQSKDDFVNDFVAEVIDEELRHVEALDELKSMTASLGFVPCIADNGVKVTKVEGEGIVVQSTLVEGDIITHLNDQAVDIESVYNFVEDKMPGDVIKVRCIRAFDGKEDIFGLELPAMVGSGSTDALSVRELRVVACLPVNTTPIYTMESATEALHNLPTLAGLKIVPGDGFVLCTHVHVGTTAAQSQAEKGDRIKKVNGQPVTDISDFQRAVKDLIPGDPITYEVERSESIKLEIDILNQDNQTFKTLTYECEMGVRRGTNGIRQELVQALRVIAGLPVFKR